MEPLFLAVICGCHAGLFREALHDVYIPRIQQGDAGFAANVLRWSEGHCFRFLVSFVRKRTLAFIYSNGGARDKVSQPKITSSSSCRAAAYLTVTRGVGAPEARICYEGAAEVPVSFPLIVLCSLYVALMGLWRYFLRPLTS